jgi:hypothetical protein
MRITKRKEDTMIRNLKTLGIAMVAVFAMSAAAASTASAASQGWLTSDGPVSLTGTDSTPFQITYMSEEHYECHTHYVIGRVNVTPHGFTSESLKDLTLKPEFSNCTALVSGMIATSTFTTNGCDFVLHITDTESSGVYRTTLDMVCEVGKEIEFHLYSNKAHSTTICTYKFPAQAGITGGTAKTSGNGITLSGTFTGIHESRTGLLCGGTNTNNNAKLDLDVFFTGQNAGGASTAISLSE